MIPARVTSGLLMFALTSCGTLKHINEPTGEYYQGLKENGSTLRMFSGAGGNPEGSFYSPGPLLILPMMLVGGAMVLVDVPVSLVSGTLLLPRDRGLRKKFTRRFRILDDKGNPVEGAQFVIRVGSGRRSHTLHPDGDGSVVTVFDPEQTTLVSLRARGYYRWTGKGMRLSEYSPGASGSAKIFTLARIQDPVEFLHESFSGGPGQAGESVPLGVREMRLDVVKMDQLKTDASSSRYATGEIADILLGWEYGEDGKISDLRIEVPGEGNGLRLFNPAATEGPENSGLEWRRRFPEEGYVSSLSSLTRKRIDRSMRWVHGDRTAPCIALRIRSHLGTPRYVLLRSIDARVTEGYGNRKGRQRFTFYVMVGPEHSRSLESVTHNDIEYWERRDYWKKKRARRERREQVGKHAFKHR